MTMEALPQDLADFLVTKNFDPEYFDGQGQPAEAGDAKTMKFDYVAATGKNYGTAVCVIADNELSLFYGDNLGRGMDPDDKQEWFEFLEQLSNKAASHAATWSPKDINQLKHTLAGIAAIKEGLFEGYYGNRRVSYMGEQTQARLVINHNRVLGEEDKRFRYVESLFIETADQERFRLPFKSLAGGRAMLEHVKSGGRPYDVRGNHITEIVSEMAVLSRFNRAQHNRVFEGVTQELVESARQYYQNLQETMKHLGSPRGYQAYFESWAPDQTGEAEALVENLRDLFVEQTLDARIEAALPTLAKIQQQGNDMKEAQIFENWINNLSEGTWALPETPEQQEKLNQLMSAELIVGPDATNATELLYDLVGDDELFDILNDLADKSQGRANIWDDSDVQRRLAELGIQTPQSTQAEPADVAQDTAPAVKEDQLNEFATNDDDDDYDDEEEDDFPEMFEAPFTVKVNGRKQTGTVTFMQSEPSSTAIWDLKGTRYIKFGMDKAHDPSDFVTHAAEYIQEIIRLDGRGHHRVLRPKNRQGGMNNDVRIGEGVAEDSRMRDFSRQDQLDHEDEIDSRAFNRLQNRITRQRGSHSAGVDIERWLKPYQILSKNNLKPKETGDRFEYLMQVALKLKGTDAGFDNSTGMSNAYKIFNLDHSEQKLIAQLMRSAPKTSELEKYLRNSQFEDVHAKTDDKLLAYYAQIKAEKEQQKKEQGVAEGDNMSTFEQDHELAEMLKYAGVPVKESVLTDSTGSTLDHIQNTFKRDVKDFTQSGDMSDALYDALYDYYFDDMPYGTKKARDGDPHEWVADRFAQDIGLDEGWKGALAGGLAGAGLGSVVPALGTLAGGIAGAYAGHKIGDQGISDPTPAPAAPGADGPRNAPIKMTAATRQPFDSGRTKPFQKPIAESSCNMTMEGSYCPEHGLAECGSMYEGHDDPINSNSAMTGSYYEGKETDIQEGDALLARIKSLALLR